MIILGLTGSIAMGKSTAGSMLEYLGVPVHDSDACVHDLLRFGSAVWRSFAAAFPYYSYPQIYGRKHFWNPFKPTVRFLKRKKLGEVIFQDEQKRQLLESILHPYVQKSQTAFIKQQRSLGREIVALDIPLLFETGADIRVDYTMNVTAPGFLQAARVMARPGMTDQKFSSILKRQMPDGEKNARADFIVHSGLGRAQMMREIKQVLFTIKKQDEKQDKAA